MPEPQAIAATGCRFAMAHAALRGSGVAGRSSWRMARLLKRKVISAEALVAGQAEVMPALRRQVRAAACRSAAGRASDLDLEGALVGLVRVQPVVGLREADRCARRCRADGGCSPLAPPTAYQRPSRKKMPPQAVKPLAISAASSPKRSTQREARPLQQVDLGHDEAGRAARRRRSPPILQIVRRRAGIR